MTTMTLSPTLDYSGANSGIDQKAFDLKKTEDSQKLLSWVYSEYTKIRQARGRIEQQWYLNYAFYLGRQNVVAVSRTSQLGKAGSLATPPAPPWRTRAIINKIRPIIRTELAKILSSKPTVFIMPSSSEDEDLMAAQAGEQVWEWLYSEKRVRKIIRDASFWTLVTGNGFVKQYWDPNAIDSGAGMGQMEGEAVDQQGDICILSLSPFHVLVPNFSEIDIENQPYVMHLSTISIDKVKLLYPEGVDGKEIKANARTENEIIDTAFVNLLGTKDLVPDSMLCIEVWIKPGAHQLFPSGAVVTVVGDQIVQQFEGWPYEHGEFPFAKLDHIPTGKFYTDSTIVDLIPLQREYNRTHSQIIEAKNRMAKPQWVAPSGSVDPKKMTSEPGQVILYQAGFAEPKQVALSPLPAYVMDELTRITSDMDDISGQHEVSKGSVPPGVTAATAISYLQEQDDSKLSHTVESLEAGIEKIGSQCLSLAVQYWDAPRLIKIAGSDESFDTVLLKASDIGDNTDLRIEAGSSLSISKAAKQATIMDLMKMQFIDPQKGLELMEIGGAAKLYEEIQVDRRQAQRENVKMQKMDPAVLQQIAQMAEQAQMTDPQTGQPIEPPPIVPVNTWDNHQIHIDVHNRFRKGQAFDMLDPSVKALYEQHVQMHLGVMTQMAQVDPNTGQPLDPNLASQAGDSEGQQDTMSPTEESDQTQQTPPVANGGIVPNG